ncbi:MAG: exodeoxyribonuclease V subunit alpha [Cardiobacteriaceae bacterium]|nr:exodeoxyribonuclease V subunit alpha [Cardiobacteriaceae bacterium]
MNHLAHYLANQSGYPEHSDTLARLFTALQQAHENGDTLIENEESLVDDITRLSATDLLGDGSTATPLVWRDNRLWYHRNYHKEAQLAHSIRQRLTQTSVPVSIDDIADESLRAEQKEAIRLAASQHLTLINGGPGTGKTYTLARLIAASMRAHPEYRIALAAPTGKAAKRMEESLSRACADLNESERNAISHALNRAQTLHRLLGMNHNGEAQYQATQLLPYDLIIIDEASMLSLELAQALFAATSAQTRLILLGDADQLAAVDPGAILHDLSHHPSLQTHRITLRESRRFSADSGIGQLARCLSSDEACGARLLEILTYATDNIHWYANPEQDRYRQLFAPYAPYLAALQESHTTPQKILAAFDEYRILCAGHHGPLGTQRINAALRLLHQRAQNLNTALEYYHGLPLMILENDHQQQLYNGDTGICLDSPHGLLLHLPDRAPVPLSRLNPATLTDAYALSIHKSQGSEYAHVALAVGDGNERLLSRELLYTGITRSKRTLDLYASAETVQYAADNAIRRHTGLSWHLEHSVI